MNWTKHLRFKHMNLLITLEETGSLSEAAKKTHTTQPALSRWLKELEDDVGSPLFHRHARGLIPTDIGKLLIQHARRIETEVDRAQHNINALQEGSSLTFAVGTSPASAPSYVPQALARFLEQHPRVRLKLFEGTMNNLLEQLKQGELDVVVGRLDNYIPQAELFSEVLYQEKICVVSRLSHPLAQRDNLSWDDLYQYDWIVWPDGTPIRSKLDATLTAAGKKPPNYRVESTSQVGNLWLLRNTDMLSIASDRVAHHFYDRGLMKPLDIKMDITNDQGAIGMCWREEEFISPIILDLLECFRQEVPNIF